MLQYIATLLTTEIAVLFIYDERVLTHDNGFGHPERPARVVTLYKVSREAAFSDFETVTCHEADDSFLALCHNADYLAFLEKNSPTDDRSVEVGPSASLSKHSLFAARLAAGGGKIAADAIGRGEHTRAILCARPPGHHAQSDAAMGFCYYNTIACTARYLQQQYRVPRVACVDFDVHFGNGTEEIFRNDPSVFYAGSHETGLWPGTGATMSSDAMNCHELGFAPGTEGREFIAGWREHLLPKLRDYNPDVILISAGFDAHWRDPLGSLALDDADYGILSAEIAQIAASSGSAAIISVLEGGYDLTALANGSREHWKALM